jgi:hypothetical protein
MTEKLLNTEYRNIHQKIQVPGGRKYLQTSRHAEGIPQTTFHIQEI